MSLCWIVEVDENIIPIEFKLIIEKNKFHYDRFDNYYYKATSYYKLELTDEFINALIALEKDSEYLKNASRLRTFYWKNTKQSWKNAKCPIFIDFDTDQLCYVLNGIGQAKGNLKLVDKDQFLQKYRT